MRMIDADKLDITPIDITDLPQGKCLNVVLLEDIQAAPTIDPVRHGRWENGKDATKWSCSQCGWYTWGEIDRPDYNYCPNCGAKMDGGDDHAYLQILLRRGRGVRQP